MSRFVEPYTDVFDTNGDPLSGAKLYFYVSGTTTPLATYSDSARSVANSNPVIADSAGRFGAIFLADAQYKVVLKTSADSTVWTADPVVPVGLGAITSDSFTGDGSTTAYTLSVSSAGGSTWLWVAIDGVLQAPAAYSLSGRTLTFSEAPPSGAVIDCRVLGIGTALVPTTEIVTVADYGAVGDGVTDDRAALVLAGASGRRVLVPAGTYKIGSSSAVPLLANTEFIGEHGAIISQANSGASKAFEIGGDNVKISGLTIRGPQTPTVSSYVANQNAIDSTNTGSSLIGTVIEGCDIYGWGGGGVQIWRPKRARVERNYIHDIGRFGVFFQGGYDSHLRHNHIKTIGPGSGGVAPFINAYGFSFTCDGTVGLERPEKCSAIGNVIEGVATWEGMDIHGGVDITFANNVVIDCMIGAYLGASSGVNNQQADGITCVGNQFINRNGTYRRGGILVSPSYSTGSVWGNNFTIANNLIEGHGLSQATYDAGYTTAEGALHIINVRGCSVTGNTIKDYHQYGVYLRQQSLGVVLAGNTITDGTTTNSLNYAINVETSASVSAQIDGNVIQEISGTVNGLQIAASGATSVYGVRWGANNALVDLTSDYQASARGRLHDKSGELLRAQAWGYITNSGTAAIGQAKGIASVNRTGAGTVNVTLSPAMVNTSYAIVLTRRSGNAGFIGTSNVAADNFDVFTWDSAGALTDTSFYVAVFGI